MVVQLAHRHLGCGPIRGCESDECRVRGDEVTAGGRRIQISDCRGKQILIKNDKKAHMTGLNFVLSFTHMALLWLSS